MAASLLDTISVESPTLVQLKLGGYLTNPKILDLEHGLRNVRDLEILFEAMEKSSTFKISPIPLLPMQGLTSLSLIFYKGAYILDMPSVTFGELNDLKIVGTISTAHTILLSLKAECLKRLEVSFSSVGAAPLEENGSPPDATSTSQLIQNIVSISPIIESVDITSQCCIRIPNTLFRALMSCSHLTRLLVCLDTVDVNFIDSLQYEPKLGYHRASRVLWTVPCRSDGPTGALAD